MARGVESAAGMNTNASHPFALRALACIALCLGACGGSVATTPDAATDARAATDGGGLVLCEDLCVRSAAVCPAIQQAGWLALCRSYCPSSSVPAACASLEQASFRCLLRSPATCGEPTEPVCPAESCAVNACVAAEQRRQGIEPNFRGTCDGGM
jgi:hypothetical protein